MKSEWRNFLLKRSNLQKLHYEDGRLPITKGLSHPLGLGFNCDNLLLKMVVGDGK